MEEQFLLSIIYSEALVIPVWLFYRLAYKRAKITGHEVAVFGFVISLTAACAVTIIPLPLTYHPNEASPAINFIPIQRTITSFYQHYWREANFLSTVIVKNFYDNVIMFMPLGLFMKLA